GRTEETVLAPTRTCPAQSGVTGWKDPGTSEKEERSMRALLSSLRTRMSLYVDRARRGHLYRPAGDTDLDRHLRAATDWLVRAQDAGADRGVSYGADFGGTWLESYPETTGYIIPTFLRLSDSYADESLARRAVEMGTWESEVQMECGAVMGGRV